jgi:hypothetical protein
MSYHIDMPRSASGRRRSLRQAQRSQTIHGV